MNSSFYLQYDDSRPVLHIDHIVCLNHTSYRPHAGMLTSRVLCLYIKNTQSGDDWGGVVNALNLHSFER